MPSFTPNNVWGSTPATGAEEELTLTSGQTCLARRMTVEAVITTGLLNEVDSLTGLVDKHTRKVKGGKGPDGVKVEEKDLLKDVDALTTIIGVVDQLLPHVVISPKVVLHYTTQTVGQTKVTKKIPLEGRESGVVYTDQIGLEDKMEIFNWALGGIEAFSTFRRGPDENVGAVENGSGPRGKAKRRRGNR